MRLLNSKIDRDKYFYFDPIIISDPEQFVPLYLARETPLVYPDSLYYHDISVPENIRHDVIQGDREYIKEVLLDQLNHPYPKEYRFSMPLVGGNLDTWQGCGGVSTICDGIAGHDEYSFSNAIVKLGLVVEHSKPLKWVIARAGSLYQQFTINQLVTGSNMTPTLLMLVKAKYIPYLRARLMLDLPFTLPLGDMKVLYRPTDLYMNIYGGMLDEFYTEHRPIVEEANSAVMLRYLCPPLKSKTKQEILTDALTIMKEELVEV